MSSQPAFGPCAVKRKLMEELQRNHSATSLLGSGEVDALIRGDWAAADSLGEERIILQEQRPPIVKHLCDHIAEHGC